MTVLMIPADAGLEEYAPKIGAGGPSLDRRALGICATTIGIFTHPALMLSTFARRYLCDTHAHEIDVFHPGVWPST